ncbi:MAG: autotransporter-associated beta strand repeat-containing protein, partial [Roseimicrobium sp.]
AALTITNLIDLNEDLIIGGTNAGTGATVHNLTASGAVALGSGDRVITVESPTVTFTVSGVVSSTGGGLIKDGDGILQLNNAANSYTGDTRVKRGLLRQGGANVLAGSDLIVESAGTVDMNGNAMTVRSLSGEDGQHGGVITNNANNTQTLTVGDVLASLDTTFAGIVTDNRAVQGSSRVNLVKTGDSRQKLAGLNSYGGTTVVNSTTTTLGGGGHLQVGVGGVGQTGTGATTVNAGSTLSGSGLINGTPGSTTHVIASAGTLSPGDSYGTVNGVLTFNGNLTLAAGSQSLLQVTSRTAHTTSVSSGGYVNAATSLGAELNTLNNTALPLGAHDALQINGTLNATGGNATTLFRVLDNGYLANAAAGDVFDLLDWTVGVTFTTFSAGTNFRAGGTGGGDLELPTLLGGNTWDVSAFTSHGLLVVVPEPSKAMLLFGSLLLMCFYRRRRAA